MAKNPDDAADGVGVRATDVRTVENDDVVEEIDAALFEVTQKYTAELIEAVRDLNEKYAKNALADVGFDGNINVTFGEASVDFSLVDIVRFSVDEGLLDQDMIRDFRIALQESLKLLDAL